MEVCPLCGYIEKRSSKLEHNIMNQYINRDNPKDVCVMNSVLEEVKTDKGVVYVRADKYGKPKTPAAGTPTSPIIAQPPAVPTQQAPIQEVNKPAVSNSGWPVPPAAQP